MSALATGQDYYWAWWENSPPNVSERDFVFIEAVGGATSEAQGRAKVPKELARLRLLGKVVGTYAFLDRSRKGADWAKLHLDIAQPRADEFVWGDQEWRRASSNFDPLTDAEWAGYLDTIASEHDERLVGSYTSAHWLGARSLPSAVTDRLLWYRKEHDLPAQWGGRWAFRQWVSGGIDYDEFNGELIVLLAMVAQKGGNMGDPIDKTRTDYMPAAHDSGAREAPCIAYLVLHDGETGAIGFDDDENMGKWFQNQASRGSAHMGADDDTRQRYLADDREAWGAPPLNDAGLHHEMAGTAATSRDEWLRHVGTAEAPLTVRRVAWQFAAWMKQYGIPPKFLDASALRAIGSTPAKPQGWTTHAQVSAAWGQTDHTDPGANFPLDVFGDLIAEYLNPQPQPEEDWMATLFDTQDEFKDAVREALVGSKSGGGPIISAADAGFGTRLSAAIYHRVADKIGSNEVDKVAAALMAKLGF